MLSKTEMIQKERLMTQDPIYIAFIVFVFINAAIIIRVWWLAIAAVFDFFRN
jgi:hypothetical protein